MTDLWRGNWATRARIVSGLALMLYALLHFLNIGLGLFSPEWLDEAQDLRQIVTRNPVGEVVLYTTLMMHAGLALWRLIERRSLRMPRAEAVQYAFGFAIPLLLLTHITYTRIAHEVFDVQDEMGYLMYLIWGTVSAWTQTILLLIVWTHGCIGLHLWLRGRTWWRRNTHLLTGMAVLVPAFALAGFVTESRRLRLVAQDEDTRLDMLDAYNFPGPKEFEGLIRIDTTLYWGFVAVLASALAIHFALRLNARRTSVRISYTNGPTITAARGQTLLEMSRSAGVDHTSLCGGKGRCTTCRVMIEAGADDLPPPSETEARSLKAVGAAPGARLACQIRPEQPMTVHRVFAGRTQTWRGSASQGQERPLAILFLDMRGFTARTAGQLPYDVVFLLNRFFDAVVPAVTASGGKIDKYLGDGFLALFETADTASSAQAGLDAAAGIGLALDAFNAGLQAEGAPPVGIGIGLHLGNVVLGEIGAAGHAPRTLIGDAVNAASRLEAQTKPMKVELLISAAVLEAAGLKRPDELVPLELRGVDGVIDALPVPKAADAPQTPRA
ncbi:adenylate/guanylate cyclase domain-containing protein [Pseudosulfitobacter pseudonitzschiae]|uniref:adenylate/guanylate cyclase domain-containing protein n=1 Tax=Pseudosulfitobacter pseudonitzschiae TaxID=1402135 RepID=UPI001AF44B9F|nr:adenylate/guanylate cyclase domain-containing protein [Pseudosulfitobacter pseudonitzschiae]MBM1814106.1 adenylate/guanylate cyclase domain-containing protein [Pseudosulfitobacter pseudonitzschiae]MBM1831099.1 adenylate/guanylate cyclase domain-containing protein [Pseudosulfitobacter pseudonitzschiae]MBM1835966.1 adenylate/guanylate cyclase domain-containing protein [Pseudosulfitobacter pseudonitzschiae]MBM1840812.1 adenylate/guanylate cyclase domain-containing protein [Pseudosulfitobacter p